MASEDEGHPITRELSQAENHTTEGDSSDGTDSGSSSEAEEDTVQVEWLATTRAKRSTAGNRMKSMLANEEPAAADDSDLELLFAEGDDDVAFTDVEKDDGSDAHMDSSSDEDEDNQAADELEGEKELQRQAREKKMADRKRKAQDAIPMKFRKKARIKQPPEAEADASAPAPAAPAASSRPKKKSERTSWLPPTSDKPTRASERATTKLSKEQLHQQMKERESKRRKQMEIQERKAKKLEAMKKPPMTQAERLVEAAIVEKRNSKSLNRWEEAEKQREEERLAKLAALNNRKLDGPVVTFWSGIQELDEAQEKHIGKMVSMEDKPRKKRESKLAAAAAAEKAATMESAQSTAPGSPAKAAPDERTPQVSPPSASANNGDDTAPVPETDGQTDEAVPSTEEKADTTSLTEAAQPDHHQAQEPMAPPPLPQVSDAKSSSGVLAAPVLALPPGTSPGATSSSEPPLDAPSSLDSAPKDLVELDTSQGNSSLPAPSPTASPPPPTGDSSTATGVIPPAPTPMAPPPPPAAVALPIATQPPAAAVTNEQRDEPASAQPLEGKVTRSCIILQNFDDEAVKDKHVQTQILFGRKMNKQSRPAHPPLCVITNHPARYRDPKTSLPYYDSYAYREIQRLQQGEYKWSALVGAWMGKGEYAARGVPKGFLDPGELEATPEGGADKEKDAAPQQDSGPPLPAAEASGSVPTIAV